MRKNLGLKAFSLVLALVVWLQIGLSSEHRTIVRLPVLLDNISPEITFSDLPTHVPFNVRGSGLDLLRLHFSAAKVVLDASTIKPGAVKLPLDDYNLRDLPANSSVEVIGPALEGDVNVTTDVMHHKSVKVAPAFESEAARTRYMELDYTLTPDQIRINGPRREIRDLRIVNTVPITLSMLSKDRFDVAIAFNSGQVSSTVAKVNITRIPVRVETRVFEAVKVDAGNQVVFPNIVTLKVEGNPDQLKSIDPASIVVKASGGPDSSGWIELEAFLPEGLDKYAITPAKVRLK